MDEYRHHGRPVRVSSHYGERTGVIFRTLRGSTGCDIHEVDFGPIPHLAGHFALDDWRGHNIMRVSSEEVVTFLDEGGNEAQQTSEQLEGWAKEARRLLGWRVLDAPYPVRHIVVWYSDTAILAALAIDQQGDAVRFIAERPPRSERREEERAQGEELVRRLGATRVAGYVKQGPVQWRRWPAGPIE